MFHIADTARGDAGTRRFREGAGSHWQNPPVPGPYARMDYNEVVSRKASVVIEHDEHGYYAWCPELQGCQTQGATLEEALANIKEAIELYLETMSEEERQSAFSREILTTAVDVHV